MEVNSRIMEVIKSEKASFKNLTEYASEET